MFLLGLYSGRRGIFQDPAAHLRFLRRVMWWGLGIGLASTVATAMAMAQDDERWVNGALYAVGRPALCLFYAAAVTVLMQDLRWRSRLGILSWAGRMGLTNYLLQSLIFTTVFYGYGLGWSAKSSSTRALVFAVVVFAAQTWWSKWWMQRFQYGPMEWLWRSLTYGKRQPMRVVRA